MKKFFLATAIILIAGLTKINAQTITLVYDGNAACAGWPATVGYYTSGTFGFGNYFNIEMSDSIGRFSNTNPRIVGVDSYSYHYNIPVQIPPATSPGTRYRLRIRSTNPVITSNQAFFSAIYPLVPDPVISVTPPGCAGVDSIHISGTENYRRFWIFGDSGYYDVEGHYLYAFPPTYTYQAQLLGPTGVFVDGAGYIYVADYSNNRIQKFPPNSTLGTNGQTVAGGMGPGRAANQLYWPSGVFVDTAGFMYVSDAANNRIQKFPPNSVAGTNAITVGGDSAGLSGSTANKLNFPGSVFVDPAGNIYVPDLNNYRVQKFPSGSNSLTNATTVAGGNGHGYSANKLSGLSTVFVDSAGYLFVTDSNRVQKFPPGSDSSTAGVTIAGGLASGILPGQFSYAVGVWIDKNGHIYVTDYGNHRVQKFPAGCDSATANAVGVTVAGGNALGIRGDQLNFPEFAFVDGPGNLFIADAYNNRIQKFPSNSTGSTFGVTVAGSLDTTAILRPSGVFVTHNGTVYATDPGNNRIQKFLPGHLFETEGITVAGGNGYGAGLNQLANPSGVFVDNADNLYVADAGNNRVIRFPSNSNYLTPGVVVAGGHGWGYSANQLSNPTGLFIDSAGVLYVADQYNSRIQKFVSPIDSNSIGVKVARSNFPTSVYVDGNQVIYATEPFTHRVRKFVPGDSIGVNFAGGLGYTGNAKNQLNTPYGLWMDDHRNMFISDITNNRIQKFPVDSPLGTMSELILGGALHGNSKWLFNGPKGIWGDTAGNIYIADSANNRIVEWNPAPLSTAILPTQPGNYYIEAVDTNGCESYVSQPVTLQLCTGIEEAEENMINIYPNPSSGSFSIKVSGALPHAKLAVYNMLGSCVYSSEVSDASTGFITEVNLKVAAGVYHVRISNQEKHFSKAIVVQ